MAVAVIFGERVHGGVEKSDRRERGGRIGIVVVAGS